MNKDNNIINSELCVNSPSAFMCLEGDPKSSLYWRDAEKELPNKNGLYIVCRIINGSALYQIRTFSTDLFEINEHAFCDDKGVPGWYEYEFGYGYYKINKVKYWMPIPELPKE